MIQDAGCTELHIALFEIMTKAEIVDIIAKGTGLTKLETEAVVDGFLFSISDALKKGEKIEIRGFGTFKVKKRKAKIARNPKTNEEVNLPERYVPVFKPSRDLKQSIEENLHNE